MTLALRTGLCAIALLALASGAVHSQPPDGPPGPSISLSVTPFYQPKVSIDGGGEFEMSGGLVRFNMSTPVGRSATIGFSLSYDADDYDFSGITELGGADPWNNVRRYGFGIPVFARIASGWIFGITPSVNLLQETGADDDESLSYGAPVFLTRSFGRKQSLGLGAGVFRRVEGDVEVFPFIAVDWQFNESWRIANPFEADVLGPAGLELSYVINPRWYIGGGGVYRSFRFRLDDEGVAPNGIGENKGFVGFVHLGRRPQDGLRLDFYAGATFAGELELRDSDGDELASSGYATAPIIAATLGLEF